MRIRITVLLLFVIAGTAHAQSRSNSAVQVVYFHKTNSAAVQTLDGKKTFQSVAADTDKFLEIDAPQTVPLCIADPNPVFFKYSKGKTTVTPNPNWAAALAFAKTIAPAAGGIEIGLRLQRTRLDDAADTLKKYAEQLPGIAAKTLNDGTVSSAQSDVNLWDLDAIASNLADPFAPSIVAEDKIDTKRDLTPDVIDDFNQKKSKNTAPQQPTTADLVKRVNELEQQLRTAAGDALQHQHEEQKRVDEASKTLKTLREFKTAVLGVNVPICLEGESISPENDATIHIIIEPVPPPPGIQAPPRKSGDIKIPTRAYSPVDLGFGAGAVYSFVKAPSFTAEKQDDGKFKIVEKKGENRAQNIAAMLTITPRPWRNPTFGGAFQLGISPVKDQIGIFGGVQLRIAKFATIGGGYGYQQVPRLDGQQAGDILEKADALKTSSHYKGGAYVSLLLSLPKAGN